MAGVCCSAGVKLEEESYSRVLHHYALVPAPYEIKKLIVWLFEKGAPSHSVYDWEKIDTIFLFVLKLGAPYDKGSSETKE